MLDVRIVCVDFYMANPVNGLDLMYSEFRGTSIHQVPVIRIFGSSKSGEKTCMHVHGIFPYMYIPYDGTDPVDRLMYQIAGGLDKAINISLSRASSNQQHVYKITHVSGIPLYGYHHKEHQFLKVYFYNPLILKKACALLQNGSILGKNLQPHEAHIPYVLQFMIDYNLHGMSFISVSKVFYRKDNAASGAQTDLKLSQGIPKISTCIQELDVISEHILNKLDVSDMAANPGIAAIWEDEKQRRRNNSQDSIVSQCLSQDRRDIKPTVTHLTMEALLKDRLSSLKKISEKINVNTSVYPAETPDSHNLLDASHVDFHSSDSTQTLSRDFSSLDETMGTDLNHSIALDNDEQNLFEILQDLEENVQGEEEDSILTQFVEEKQDSGDELDMTLPLENVKTPERQMLLKETDESDCEDLYFLPQLDGCNNCARKLYSNKSNHKGETCKNKLEALKTSLFQKRAQINGVTQKLDATVELQMQELKQSKSNMIVGSEWISDANNKTIDEAVGNIRTFNVYTLNCISNKYKRKKISKEKQLYKKQIMFNKLQHNQTYNSSNVKPHLNELSIKENMMLEKWRRKRFKSSDGPNDTSSSDEEATFVSKPQTPNSSKKHSQKYNPLAIQIYQSPLRRSKEVEDLCGGSKNSPLHFATQGPSKKFKRNLNIEKDLVAPDVTLLEEKLVCRLKLGVENEKLLTAKKNTQKNLEQTSELHDDAVESVAGTPKVNNEETQNDPKQNVFHCIETKLLDKKESDETIGCYENKSLEESYSNSVLAESNNSNVLDVTLVNEGCLADDNKSLNSDDQQSEGSSNDTLVGESHTVNESLPKQFSGDLTVFEPLYELDSGRNNLWTPKYNAPTYQQIEESLINFNIPLVRHQEPFYSHFADVTGNVEVGAQVLKIRSNTVCDLKDFQSTFFGLDEQRKEMCNAENKNIKELKKEINAIILSHSGNEQCLITPAKSPPTKIQVENWLKGNNDSFNLAQKVKKERKKITMPLSPGVAGADSDVSISLSGCSSVTNKTLQESGTTNVCDASNLETSILKEPSRTSQLSTSVQSSPANSDIQEKSLQSEDCKHPTVKNFLVKDSADNSGEITGVTLDKTFNFKMTLENLQNVKTLCEHQHLTTVVMEVHVQTRADMKPDPSIDSIKAIFYAIVHDAPNMTTTEGVIVFDSRSDNKKQGRNDLLQSCGLSAHSVAYTNSEKNLVLEFIDVLRKWDPDILIGYETEMLSWGYLIDRGYHLELNMGQLLSRIPNCTPSKYADEEVHVDLKVPGRIVLNFWRLLRHEIALQSYTFENIMFHILHERVPLHSFKDLTFWWENTTNIHRYKVVNFYVYRLRGILKLLDQLDLIGRTSELARLFGIQFYEVLSRGSQFRVESMMLRLAKPSNYIAVSPSVQQRAKMKAPEYLPLILEPESKLYVDPVVVLDFQSKIEHLGQNEAYEFGATQLKTSPKRIKRLVKGKQLNYSPCGVAFVKPDVRKGTLPRMLEEILGTRLMVKKSMKKCKDNKTLSRVLHSRQLGLKLIANVTYGYTAANFSGRMPAVELADSVVGKGRETLQRAIHLVENTPEWGARVVYGDTDSLFVLIPGKSKEEAFRIGEEIAERVTSDNPSPVRLKMEKVYQPCILQTKKRYVGYMYEAPDQKEPDFDAKGIETVRRDGCPAVSKMLEKCLRILFDTRDVSKVRKYVERQLNKLLAGRVSIQDLTFAKEYRGSSGYRPGACVPALELARKWTAVDKRNEPRSGERVPYVIVNGPPGLPLIRLVRSPHELLKDPSLRPNTLYYITKVIIPPINRCFTLIGADLNNWYNEMSRKQIHYLPIATPTKRSTISQYFNTINCAACEEQTREGICNVCISQPQRSVFTLQNKITLWEQSYYQTKLMCQSCCGSCEEIQCISLDCPILYRLEQRKRDVQQVPFIRDLIATNFTPKV